MEVLVAVHGHLPEEAIEPPTIAKELPRHVLGLPRVPHNTVPEILVQRVLVRLILLAQSAEFRRDP
jgi:hypothetical protein